MSITQNNLDNLVHTLGNGLSAYGVDMDSDLLGDLNDLLSDFITDTCDEEIIDDESESQEVVSLCFDIKWATVTQTARITHPDYTAERIIEGLQAGTLVTKTGFDHGDMKCIDIAATGERVAELISQEVDGEYEDFSEE